MVDQEIVTRPSFSLDTISYAEAKSAVNEAGWQSLGSMTIQDALDVWLETLSPCTRKTYEVTMRALAREGLVDPSSTLKLFALRNASEVVDQIKQVPHWSEATRQSRAGTLISFTGFLERRTDGLIRKARSVKGGVSATFWKIRDRVVTEAMTRVEWTRFLHALARRSLRNCLIAKLALQGGKRIGEVLELTWDKVDPIKREITFRQSKMKTHRDITISFPEEVFTDLAILDETGTREGFVFLSGRGNRVSYRTAYTAFVRAGKEAGIKIKTTPHVLRVSCVTYLMAQGYSAAQVMQITGHASSAAVDSYNKSAQADNVSKQISLV